jgi:membrane associated rhomboid family serine protease
MRNNDFMSRAQTFNFGGDDIAIAHWRKRLKDFMKVQDANPSYRWGLSRVHGGWMNWFTYQFAHAGFSHLFWNMIFLMIFGCFVESQLGSSFVAIGYIVGGLAGAWSYSVLSGISYSPLVGASGAVSGLIGLVTVAWWRREHLPFLYMLIPSREYMGIKLLPSWLLGLVFLLPDLSHYLSSTKEVGSVAYSAHIGGALFGALIAFGVTSGLLPKKEKAPQIVTPKLFEQKEAA